MILEKIAGFWINTLTPQMNLSELDDKIILLRVDSPAIEQSLYFHGQRVELDFIPTRDPDIIITGDIYTVIQFLGGNDRAKVTIEGDLSLAVVLQQIIQTASIDCQEWLSQATSQFIPDPVRSFSPFSSKTYDQSLLDRIVTLEARIRELEKKVSS